MSKIVKISTSKFNNSDTQVRELSDREKLFLDLIAKIVVNNISSNSK